MVSSAFILSPLSKCKPQEARDDEYRRKEDPTVDVDIVHGRILRYLLISSNGGRLALGGDNRSNVFAETGPPLSHHSAGHKSA